MGTVYRAHDPAIDRVVAIKVVRTDGADDATRQDFLDRFRTEVQAAGRCAHPGIVGVYDYSGDGGDPFIVMEFVEGQTLRDVIRAAARPPIAAFVELVLQVLAALEHAHALGIVHRDIKPGNVMVTPDGRAKIADFGVARLNRGAHTQNGALLGTPSYMAPEQVMGQPVDHRTDLFAAGAMLYEILAGRPPFGGASLTETIYRLTSQDPVSLDEIEAAGHGRFAPILRRALAKDAAERFQSAAAFAESLRGGGAASAAPPDGTVVMTLADLGYTLPPAPATPPAESGPATGSSGGSRTGRGTVLSAGGTRWTPDTLDPIERQLARFVGPMAKLTVRQLAAISDTIEELVRAVSATLPREADRREFLRGVPGGKSEPSLATQTSAQTLQRNPPPGGAPTFAPEALKAAQALLAVHVGPIAKVLVQQAARTSTTPREFCDRLPVQREKARGRGGPAPQARRRCRASAAGLSGPARAAR